MGTELGLKNGKRVHYYYLHKSWYIFGLTALIVPGLIGLQTAWGDPLLPLTTFIRNQGQWSSPKDEEHILSHLEALEQSCYDSCSLFNPEYYARRFRSCPRKCQLAEIPSTNPKENSAVYFAALYDYPRVLQQLERLGVRMRDETIQSELHLALCEKLKFQNYSGLNSDKTFTFLAEKLGYFRLNTHCKATGKLPLEELSTSLLRVTTDHSQLASIDRIIKIFKILTSNKAKLPPLMSESMLHLISQASINNYGLNGPEVAKKSQNHTTWLAQQIGDLLPTNDKGLLYRTLFLTAASQGNYDVMNQVIRKTTPLLFETTRLQSIAELALEISIFNSHQFGSAAALLETFYFDQKLIHLLQDEIVVQLADVNLPLADRQSYQQILTQLLPISEGSVRARAHTF